MKIETMKYNKVNENEKNGENEMERYESWIDGFLRSRQRIEMKYGIGS